METPDAAGSYEDAVAISEKNTKEPERDEPVQGAVPVLLEWNAGASMFLAGHAGSLQFRISPIRGASCEDVMLLAILPDTDRPVKRELPVQEFTQSYEFSLNVRLSDNFTGINQGIPIYVSVVSDGLEKWYCQEISVDVYPMDAPAQSMIENLNIRMGDQVFTSDRASDQSVSSNVHLLENLGATEASPMKLLQALKNREPDWCSVPLMVSRRPDAADMLPCEPSLPAQRRETQVDPSKEDPAKKDAELTAIFREVQAAKQSRQAHAAASSSGQRRNQRSGLFCPECHEAVEASWVMCPHCEKLLGRN